MVICGGIVVVSFLMYFYCDCSFWFRAIEELFLFFGSYIGVILFGYKCNIIFLGEVFFVYICCLGNGVFIF